MECFPELSCREQRPACLPFGRTVARATLLWGCAGGCVTASAEQLAQSQLVGPAYMVSVCGGLGQGDGYSAGNAVAVVSSTSNCLSSSGGSSAGNASQGLVYSWTSQNLSQATQASGTAGFGIIHLDASYGGSNNAGFDQAVATGGWQDVFTINAVDPTNSGKQAVMTFALGVEGELDASTAGGNTGAHMAIQAWQTHNLTSAAYLTSIQATGNQTEQSVIDGVQSLSVSFTLGQTFTLGIFGSAFAGNASASGATAINHASSDFANTVFWDGINSIKLNGSSIDYSVTSASGTDWRNAVTTVSPVPEPSDAALLLAGLCVMGQIVRRRVRSASP